jgi:hypothetical protein
MSTPDDGLPELSLGEPEDAAELIKRLQSFVLKHPFAAQAAFSALISEGEAFARTPEGAAWRDRLVNSELVHRARLALDLPGLSLLGRSDASAPSGFVDAIFMLASSRRPDEMLDALFAAGIDSDER